MLYTVFTVTIMFSNLHFLFFRKLQVFNSEGMYHGRSQVRIKKLNTHLKYLIW